MVLAATVLIAACGGSGGNDIAGVAGVDAPTTSPDGSALTNPDPTHQTPDAVAYSQCMRDHGVAGFPDPQSNGELAVSSETLGVPIDSPTYLQAEQTCAPLLPVRSASEQQAAHAERLEYAQCMRDNGIVDFPDPPVPSEGPTTNSAVAGQANQGAGVDPESAQFRSAHDACKDRLPTGDEGPSLSQQD